MLKIKKIKPMFTSIVTTMDRYENDVKKGGIINTLKQQGAVKEIQKVVAVGTSVRDIKVGDMVCVNPTRFARKKHKEGSLKDGIITDNPTVEYSFDVLELDDVPHLLLQDRDIDFIVEEFEEVEEPEPSGIVIPKTIVS